MHEARCKAYNLAKSTKNEREREMLTKAKVEVAVINETGWSRRAKSKWARNGSK